MPIKFENEYFKLRNRGVYKIVFDDKWYYIGSSTNLYGRLNHWRHNLKTGQGIKNRSIIHILPIVKVVKFEIIEFVKMPMNPKIQEEALISLHFDDVNCLNISKTTVVLGRHKKHLGYVPKPPKQRGLPIVRKAIAKIDKDGNILETFPSIYEAARKTGCSARDIGKIVSGLRFTTKGNIFRPMGIDGNIIHPKRKRNTVAEAARLKAITNGKRVAQFDMVGNFIAEHYNAAEAARVINSNSSLILKNIKGRKGCKSVKGFVFKYA